MKKTKKKFSKKWRSYVKTAELAVSVAAVSAVSDKKTAETVKKEAVQNKLENDLQKTMKQQRMRVAHMPRIK